MTEQIISACGFSKYLPLVVHPNIRYDWEHEIFIHSGNGEVYNNGNWTPVSAGSIVFIPGSEEHQIRNTGNDKLVFACLIPSTAPEL